MPYTRRLGLAIAILGVGSVAALIVVGLSATGGSTVPPSQLRSQVCAEQPLVSWQNGLLIFRHNLLVLSNVLLGAFLIGIRMAAQLAWVGFDATVRYTAALDASQSHWFPIAGLVPHGIFEMTAFVMAGATGVGISRHVLHLLLYQEWPTWAQWRGLGEELPLPMAALCLAAVIEELFTPYAIRWAIAC